MTSRGKVIVTSTAFALFCGGKSSEIDQPPGFVGADGNYLSPDGSAVFTQGAACQGYDPSTFDIQPHINCVDRSDCFSWASARVPNGYPEFTYCAGGQCRVNIPDVTNHQIFSDENNLFVHCNPGPSGDAFCTSYFNQFVLGSGETIGRCIQGQDFGACAADRGCWDLQQDAGAGGSCDDLLDLCVTRNSAYGCEPPCAPLSVGGDE